ncbi:MAG: hypothetical protein GXY32_01850 [Ruminococcaceae bacterium]|nr:hypothetical protein [Oscillospiraceae bacterium]
MMNNPAPGQAGGMIAASLPAARQPYQPPPGTYPSQHSPPVVPDFSGGAPPPDSTKRGRRVGTFTMAISLIAVGVLLILSIFLPQLDIIAVARYAPVVLILLGVELLVSHLLHKREKLRFDGLSVFISLLLIAASLTAAVVPQIVQRRLEIPRINARLVAQLEAESSAALQAAGLPPHLAEWYVNVDYGPAGDDLTPKTLTDVQYVQFRLSLEGDYATAEAFADDCRRALEAVLPLVSHIDYATFQSGITHNWPYDYHGDTFYQLWLDDRAAVDNYETRLYDFVTTSRWSAAENSYTGEWVMEPVYDDPA